MMELASVYLLGFSIGITILYFFMMASWNVSWKLYSLKAKIVGNKLSTSVTVILPVRNEEANIEQCLKCLVDQDYPAGKLEIIVSDDFSTDNTAIVCKKFIESLNSASHNVKLIKASDDFGSGKKSAIEHAIHHSKGELIITIDADCTMGSSWVKSYAVIFENSRPEMITGFVRIKPVNSFFSALQALEFLSLSQSAAMTIIRRKPLMCNGANLAFSKASFIEAGGYRYGSKDPSGDDTYLMLKIAGKNSSGILFNNNPQSIVSTKPEPDLASLISQRIRWASKVKNYKESYIKRTGIFIFILNFLLMLTPILAFAGFISWKGVLSAWILKLIADLFILIPACMFASQRNLLLLFLPAGVIYPFYSFAAMVLSFSKSGYNWKERNYKMNNGK